MPRGDALARQLQLIQILESKRKLKVGEAAKELGFSRRTVYRDLQVLARIGVPIYQKPTGSRTWHVVDGYRHRLSLTLSWIEMLAMAAGAELLAGLKGSLFIEGARSALDKARAALPLPLAKRARAMMRHLSGTVGVHRDYRSHGADLEVLIRATEISETVALTYRKTGAKAYDDRMVDPHHVHVQAGAVYMVGWCHSRRAMRIFLLEYARNTRLTGARFTRQNTFVPEAYFHGAFGPWSGKPRAVRLRCDKGIARAIAEQHLHPSQTTQWRADGSLDIGLNVPLSPALVAWVMGWGPRVSVLSPKTLRDRVRKEHHSAAST